jgi:protein phosphatase
VKKKLTDIFRNSFSPKKERLSHLIGKVMAQLEEERIKASGGTVILPSQGKAIIVGDIHGDINSLYTLLKETRFIERTEKGEDLKLIFLGDYGDRGQYSPEVFYVVFYLKQTKPERVFLLRGNHEGLPLIPFSPHDVPIQLQLKYGEHWNDIYNAILKLFSNLPHCLIIENKYLLLHGGAPNEIASLSDLSLADQLFPLTTHFEEILWNDPKEDIKGVQPSIRGLGKFFGEDVTSKVLEITKTRTLIRSHESCDGVSVNHSGKVLTLFSRNGTPYLNDKRAYLELDLSLEPKDAFTLAKEATIF